MNIKTNGTFFVSCNRHIFCRALYLGYLQQINQSLFIRTACWQKQYRQKVCLLAHDPSKTIEHLLC
jgi:hypothetical protein